MSRGKAGSHLVESVSEAGMIIERVGIVAHPENREDLRRGLASLVGPTQVESGCIECRLYQESANMNAFRFESQWRTLDDFLLHARSDRYRTLLELVETSVTPPIIEFHQIAETHGLDLVRAARERSTRSSTRSV